MELSYYERNKQRIRQYYHENRDELKAKALARYYKKKAEEDNNIEPLRKKHKPYEFKIEWMNQIKSQEEYK